MSSKQGLKANFAVDTKHGAFYTGGKVQFSADGSKMLCKCTDRVNVLDVATGTVSYSYCQEEEGEVSTFVLSPDDKVLVIAFAHLLLKQYDFQTKQNSRTWKAIHVSPVSTMAFDVTSTLLATGGSDATIKVWDVIQQYCTHNLKGHRGVISTVLFHPDPDKLQLFSAGEDYMVRVWDLKTSVCVAALEGHYSVVTAIAITPDHCTMYTSGRDKVINVWDLQKHTKARTIPVYETVESVILLDKVADKSKLNIECNADHFITAGSKGLLRIWNAATAQCVFSQSQLVGGQPYSEEDDADPPTDDTNTLITDAMYASGLGAIAVVSYDHNIFLYNVTDLSPQKQFAGYNDEVLDVKLFGPEESHLVVATNSELLKVFSLETWAVQLLRGHTDIILAVDVFKGGTLAVTSSKDNKICVWQMDVETKIVSLVATAYGHTNDIQTLACPKLSTDFLVSGSQDLTLKLWTVPDTLSPDNGVISLMARATEKAHDKDINSVTVAPNDKLIASASLDKTAKLWNAQTFQLLGVFRGHKRGLWCVQFSPVDQCIATASSDCTVRIWALSDYSCVKTFEGHDALVLQVHFVSRGMQLITSGSDGLMKLWTIKTSECIKTFDEHDDKVWALAVSKDEQKLITGGGDSNIVLWKDVTEIELEEQRNKQVDAILKEQKLMNLLQQKKYFKALTLAITMEQPFRALNIIKEILGDPDYADDLATTLSKLRRDQLDAILRFSIQWNTNSRHCHVAQCVVSTVIQTTAPEVLLSLSNARTALEGLLPYTEKHFARMNRLLQQAMFVDYTWSAMRLASGDALVSDREQPTDHAPSFTRLKVTQNVGTSDEESSSESMEGSREIPASDEDSTSGSSDDGEDMQTKKKTQSKSFQSHKTLAPSEASDTEDSDLENEIQNDSLHQENNADLSESSEESSEEEDEEEMEDERTSESEDDTDVKSKLAMGGLVEHLKESCSESESDSESDLDFKLNPKMDSEISAKIAYKRHQSSVTKKEGKIKAASNEGSTRKLRKLPKQSANSDGSMFSDKENSSAMSSSDERFAWMIDKGKTPVKKLKESSIGVKTPSTAPLKRTKKVSLPSDTKRKRRKSHA